tara:strand:- start:180 stop:572 length:393 start_codon:yes stop_codon:yes gene_type:complete
MRESRVVEAYLARTGLPYTDLSSNTWLIDDEGDEIPPMIVSLASPLIVFSCRVCPLPEGAGAKYYRALLELNAAEMTAGAYGVVDGWVVISDTLQSENLDYNEFHGAIEGIVMALSAHYSKLKGLADLCG